MIFQKKDESEKAFEKWEANMNDIIRAIPHQRSFIRYMTFLCDLQGEWKNQMDEGGRIVRVLSDKGYMKLEYMISAGVQLWNKYNPDIPMTEDEVYDAVVEIYRSDLAKHKQLMEQA